MNESSNHLSVLVAILSSQPLDIGMSRPFSCIFLLIGYLKQPIYLVKLSLQIRTGIKNVTLLSHVTLISVM